MQTEEPFSYKTDYHGIAFELNECYGDDGKSLSKFDLWIGGELIAEKQPGMVDLLERGVKIMNERLAR